MKFQLNASLAALCLLAAAAWSARADDATNAPAATTPFPVTITVEAAQPVGELTPIWRFFGADEPNYA